MTWDVFLLAMIAWLTGCCLVFSAIFFSWEWVFLSNVSNSDSCYVFLCVSVSLSLSRQTFFSEASSVNLHAANHSPRRPPLPLQSSPTINKPLSPVSPFLPLLAHILLPVLWWVCGYQSGKHCISESWPGSLRPHCCCTHSPHDLEHKGTSNRKVGEGRCSAVGNHWAVLFVSVVCSQWTSKLYIKLKLVFITIAKHEYRSEDSKWNCFKLRENSVNLSFSLLIFILLTMHVDVGSAAFLGKRTRGEDES